MSFFLNLVGKWKLILVFFTWMDTFYMVFLAMLSSPSQNIDDFSIFTQRHPDSLGL